MWRADSLENSSRFAHGRPLTPYVDRHHFNAIVTEQDLEDTYLPPFQSGVVYSVSLCSVKQIAVGV